MSAQIYAQDKLHKRLDCDLELVPCPRCQWVNERAVAYFRQRKFRRVPALAQSLFVLGGIAFVILSGVTDESRLLSSGSIQHAIEWSVIFPMMAILLFPVRSLLRRRIDPNRRSSLPPGTPPAMLLVRDQMGTPRLQIIEACAGPQSARDEDPIFRAGQLLFPEVCCLCLRETTSKYRKILKLNRNSSALPVPLCRDCKRLFTLPWRLTAVASVAGSYAIGMLAFTIPNFDQTSHSIIALAIGFPLAVYGLFVIPDRVVRPYRYRFVDRYRGVTKFASKNSAYTQLLLEQAREQERAAGLREMLGKHHNRD
jgi:hypothetical protein